MFGVGVGDGKRSNKYNIAKFIIDRLDDCIHLKECNEKNLIIQV